MSVLIHIHIEQEKIKKNYLELANFGCGLASQHLTNCVAFVTGESNSETLTILSKYGISEVILDTTSICTEQYLLHTLFQIAQDFEYVILCHNNIGKNVAPRLSVTLKAAIVSAVVGLDNINTKNSFPKNVFSGKAKAYYKLLTPKKIITLSNNSYGVIIVHKIIERALNISNWHSTYIPNSKIKILSTNQTTSKINLSEAEIVVSAGRGLKDPKNWHLIEDLANILGAATSCSRPVSDLDWRPHHEHVGQTGLTIRPNLYLAIGISGAIQHLAGVNGSRIIVVINIDAEAPFFKYANYGVVGDAFEIIPRLMDALRLFKAS